ncbi:MAG TPA: TonB-dependent receptor [Pyrinomonadaceae bacterium]|jgi:hypothetical protein
MKMTKTIALILLLAVSALTRTQTTGRIAGTVKDQQNALIVGADIAALNQANGEARTAVTDESGNFVVAFLTPGVYRVRIEAGGYNVFTLENVTVRLTETTTINATLGVAGVVTDPITVRTDAPLIKIDNPTLGQLVDGQTAAALPLATRNFTQLFALAPGTSAFLTDNTVVGRNPANVSASGARPSQNNFQINGIDSNFGFASSRSIADPAPESIDEFKIQTSSYDASFGRAGGANVQIVTRSGTNNLRGTIYDYFADTSLNANNPFLKAAGLPRPVLERNIFGFTLGGAIKKDRAFFFASYQATRERNGAARLGSISSNVLIGQGSLALTDDRSRATLLRIFKPVLPNGERARTVNPVALQLLNTRLPSGQFLIPTPQTGARYSGSAVSRFREDQFNLNFDFRLTTRNLLGAKVFFAHAPQISAIYGNANVPGFPTPESNDSTLVSVQDVQSFGPNLTNEARIGFNFFVSDLAPQPPFLDSEFGISRPAAQVYPGFPLISIAIAAGGIRFGTSGLNYQQAAWLTPAFADTLSFTRRTHSIRAGFEFRYYLMNINVPILTRGNIVFQNFNDFLLGITQSAALANGISDRALRAADYNFFVQDDWKFSEKLNLNLGLRYELDLPAYDTRGRIAAFDPALYRPSLTPNGPPQGGIVQAGNPAAGYDLPDDPTDNLPDVPNVGKRLLKSLDANNFAPRVGAAYAPFSKKPFVLRAAFGIYYSRSALAYLVNNIFLPPFYSQMILPNTSTENFGSPFAQNLPTHFPALESPVTGISIDRNIRTPYFQQYNAAAQLGISKNTTLEIAYVGSRGLNLFRQVAINQARLTATNNTPAIANVQNRAPFQGVGVGGSFLQDQSTAQSTYNSLQLNLTRRLSRGLQFQASYTFSKSIDNASGGTGAGTNGLTDTQTNIDTGAIVGNQLDNRANRGLSNFDRRHRFVSSFIWQLPRPAFINHSKIGRALFSGWQIAGIVTAMSGLPVDVVDSQAASFYLGANGGGARPNFDSRFSPTENVPHGYYFNPFAFRRPIVAPGQPIPSSNNTAIAGAVGTDFGNVGRNILPGPNQFNTDFSVSKRFRPNNAKNIEFRIDFFNLFNTVNFANPISNFAAVAQSGGVLDAAGNISENKPGDFGKLVSTSNNPRIVQLALKFNF